MKTLKKIGTAIILIGAVAVGVYTSTNSSITGDTNVVSAATKGQFTLVAPNPTGNWHTIRSTNFKINPKKDAATFLSSLASYAIVKKFNGAGAVGSAIGAVFGTHYKGKTWYATATGRYREGKYVVQSQQFYRFYSDSARKHLSHTIEITYRVVKDTILVRRTSPVSASESPYSNQYVKQY
jgi:hypothetical protein